MKYFHRAIFFTKVPIGGFFTYKDVFQVLLAEHLENIPTTSCTRFTLEEMSVLLGTKPVQWEK